jgi:hypothetical protein
MGVIFGIVNLVVAVWFYASAVSVKKPALKWAVIGGLSFLAFKFIGYLLLATLQGSLIEASLDDLSDQGYVQTERSADALASETSDDQYTVIGIFYEFFPLIVALLGVSFIRAKFILGMGYIDSLRHETPLKLITKGDSPADEQELPKYFGALFEWWKKRKSN